MTTKENNLKVSQQIVLMDIATPMTMYCYTLIDLGVTLYDIADNYGQGLRE